MMTYEVLRTIHGEPKSNKPLAIQLLHALELVLPVIPGSLDSEPMFIDAITRELDSVTEFTDTYKSECNCDCKLCIMSDHSH